MMSPTQRAITRADVVAMAATAFGASVGVADAQPLTGGSFGSVWRVTLRDGRPTVLKVGPDPAAKVLTYETGMVAAEAQYLQLAAGAPSVPTPRLLYHSDEFMFMTFLPGTPMPSLPDGTDVSAVRRECGVALANLHAVTGDRFGYSGSRPAGATWPEAFTAMVEALLHDAVAWGVTLPVDPGRVRAAVAAHSALLGTVSTPALVHFDLWDGNVLVTPDGHLGGLVDGERYLFGDPLVDFASVALFRDIFDEPDHPFLQGYLSRRPFTIDDAVRRRAWLYQLYLYLVMTVEFPSRGMSLATDRGRWDLQAERLHTLLSHLESPPPGRQ